MRRTLCRLLSAGGHLLVTSRSGHHLRLVEVDRTGTACPVHAELERELAAVVKDVAPLLRIGLLAIDPNFRDSVLAQGKIVVEDAS